MDSHKIDELKIHLKDSGIELINKSFNNKNNVKKIFWELNSKDINELIIENKYYLLFLSLGVEYLLKYLYLENDKSIFKTKDEKIYQLNDKVEFNYNRTLDFYILIDNINEIVKDKNIKDYKETMDYLRKIRNGIVHLFKDEKEDNLFIKNQCKIKKLLIFLKIQIIK